MHSVAGEGINSTAVRSIQNRPDFADAEKLFLLFKYPWELQLPRTHDGSYFCSSPSGPYARRSQASTASLRTSPFAVSVPRARTVGIGSDIWGRVNGLPWPAELHPFPAVKGAVHTTVSTPGDLFFHIRSERRDLLWTLLLTRSTRDGQHTYRDILYDYEFEDVDSEVQKRLQFSDLHDLLMDWKRAIRILNQFSNTKSKGIPPNLICIVQAMEAKTDVKLGGLIECVFQLEELHRSSGLNKQFDPSRRSKTCDSTARWGHQTLEELE